MKKELNQNENNLKDLSDTEKINIREIDLLQYLNKVIEEDDKLLELLAK